VSQNTVLKFEEGFSSFVHMGAKNFMIVITFANRCNALFPQGEVANIQVLDRTRAHTLSYHTSGMHAS